MNKIAFAILALFLVSCAPVAPEQTVKIGAVVSLTGIAAVYGESIREGMDLAVEQVNAQGGINGKHVEVIYEDDGTDGAKATTAFQKLVNANGVSAVVGGTWDFNYNAIAPLAQEYKTVLLTPENPKTKALLVNNYTFVMIPPLGEITKSLKGYISENKFKKIAVVHFVSPYGEEIAQALKETAQKVGAEFVLDETYTQIGGNDFLTTATKVKSSGADVVFIDMVGGDITNFIKRLQDNNVNITILGHGGIKDAAADKDTPKGLLNEVVYFDYNKPTSQEFITLYKDKYGKEPQRSADRSYDSVMILAEALKNTEREKLNEYIASHEFTTINGKLSFRNNVATARDVFVERVTENGTQTVERKTVRI
ncbi:MAG TPA: ABC transporter substrate-binding protein [Candidatus Nanoarchaeia archaeon]|nr:ABC transporter substrate-binding protein [Candidatus Nanoarchaeia archaeon]